MYTTSIEPPRYKKYVSSNEVAIFLKCWKFIVKYLFADFTNDVNISRLLFNLLLSFIEAQEVIDI